LLVVASARHLAAIEAPDMEDSEDLGIEDTSHLTDADWAAINKLVHAYKTNGQKALQKEMKALMEQDEVRYYRIMAAFFPQKMSDTIRDAMAEMGVTEEDVREMAERLNPPLTKQ
jgi:hypothetical protein